MGGGLRNPEDALNSVGRWAGLSQGKGESATLLLCPSCPPPSFPCSSLGTRRAFRVPGLGGRAAAMGSAL